MQIKGWGSQEISGKVPEEGDTLDSPLAAVHENGKLCEESPTLLSSSLFHWRNERGSEGFLSTAWHSHSPMPLPGVRHLVGQDWWHREGRQGWGVGRWGSTVSIHFRALVNAICWSISGTRGGTHWLAPLAKAIQPTTHSLSFSLAHTLAKIHRCAHTPHPHEVNPLKSWTPDLKLDSITRAGFLLYKARLGWKRAITAWGGSGCCSHCTQWNAWDIGGIVS